MHIITIVRDVASTPDHCIRKDNVKQSNNGCQYIGCVVSVFLVWSIIACIVSVPVLIAQNPSYSKEMRVVEGDTVILLSFLPLHYSEISVREKVEMDDSDHSIHSYLIPCKSLIYRFDTLHFTSRNLSLKEPTYQFGEQPGNTPIYLTAGSNISYKFRIWSSIQQPKQPQFVIFDNYNDYQMFQDGVNDESNAVFRQAISASPQNSQLTEVTYSITNEGYYFITGYSEAGLSYQFNATDNVYYLNESDYSSKYKGCYFHSGTVCSFQASDTFFGTKTEMCLIAHIIRPVAEDPPSTHIVINVRKNYAILVYPGTVASASLTILVIVIVLVYIVKRKKRVYTRSH